MIKFEIRFEGNPQARSEVVLYLRSLGYRGTLHNMLKNWTLDQHVLLQRQALKHFVLKEFDNQNGTKLQEAR